MAARAFERFLLRSFAKLVLLRFIRDDGSILTQMQRKKKEVSIDGGSEQVK